MHQFKPTLFASTVLAIILMFPATASAQSDRNREREREESQDPQSRIDTTLS